MIIDQHIVKRARKKASKSTCRCKLAVCCFNKSGDLIGILNNRPRFLKPGGGIHAEQAAIKRFGGKNIRSILVLRVNDKGHIKPISVCPACRRVLDKYKINVICFREKA